MPKLGNVDTQCAILSDWDSFFHSIHR